MKLSSKMSLFFLVLAIFVFNCHAEDYWMKTSFTDQTFDVFCPNSDEVFIVSDWDTYISQNMGITWEMFLDWRLIHISKTNDKIYFDRYGGTIFVLDRNTGVIDSLASVAAGRMYEIDESFIMRGYSKVSKSDKAWSNIYTIFDVGHGGEELTCFAVDSAGTYYLGSTDFMNVDQPGGVYKSYDQGETWTYPDLPNHFVRAMAVDSEGRIFVGTCGHYYNGTGQIYRSEDNGNSWQLVANGVYVFSMAINSEDEIFVGLDYESGNPWILYSDDNGSTWSYLNDGLSTGSINDIAISPDGYVYLATGGGSIASAGVYRSINSTTGIEEKNHNTVNSFELYQNYPNPFNNDTEIQFRLEKATQIELNIFNSKGEFVRNLISSKLNKGKHNFSFNADKINSGIYFYRLSVDGVAKETKKMLYLK